MVYNWTYKTHLGFDDIMMTSDGEFLTGLWFVNSSDDLKHSFKGNSKFLPIFKDTCKWLDVYFSGRNPDFTVKYKVSGLTDFRKDVISEMLKINPKLPIITSVKKYMDSLPSKNLKEMLNRDIFASNVYTLGYEMDSWANLDYTNKIITM